MAKPTDVGHRPHAVHTGETPTTRIARGPEALSVTLDTWGPKDFARPMYDALQANWGESPSRTTTEQDKLTPSQLEYLDRCFGGQTLPQVLEGLSFWFTIDGVSRATTHQLVRSRMGAAFMQHGGRDNDWRHRGWTMPETIARACEADLAHGKKSTQPYPEGCCVTSWKPLDDLMKYEASIRGVPPKAIGLDSVIEEHIERGKHIYAALVDAGIPWQDARRVLTMGSQTYIHAIYNYQALKGVLANRLEHVMDWEINCVAQLMLREVRMQCPKGVWLHLGSHSDRTGRAAMAAMTSWTPDHKHPMDVEDISLNRAHRPEQNPFWILAPESMEGGPIRWIPTNGTYPHEALGTPDKK